MSNQRGILINKHSQVTLFIIIGILLIAGVFGYFIFKSSISSKGIPSSFEPFYRDFLSCIESNTEIGVSILESQGGYISLPDFESGSGYSPFGSQLNFLGNPVPYWYYVSGNNIPKEQVPTKKDMEEDLADFIESTINKCDFEKYFEQGLEIDRGVPKVEVNIKDNLVIIDVKMDLSMAMNEESYFVNSHGVEINRKLGKLYNSALEIYNYEQKTLFLENYAIDSLRLYAPVDGVELTCSPLVWNAEEVFEELHSAIVSNTLALKNKNGDYKLADKRNEYFLVDMPVDENVNFLTSSDWAYSFEVNPSQGAVLISEPVGNQEGLGVLGFCYVPYHFVYNLNYPVLVQVYDSADGEIFQFPLAVVVKGNKPRKSLEIESGAVESSDLCKYKNNPVSINVYDSKLNPVDARISYKCFDEVCTIGETSSGLIEEDFPQCVNGYLFADAEGYKSYSSLFSSIDGGNFDVILDNLYELEVELKIGGRDVEEMAIITFSSDSGGSQTIMYPEQKNVELSRGQYEIFVYLYENSSLKLAGENQKYCIDVPKEGVGSLIGLTEEKCYEIEIPEQIISNALSGGGKQSYYILENELESSSSIQINADRLARPKTLEDLQNNYNLFETKGLEIYFK